MEGRDDRAGAGELREPNDPNGSSRRVLLLLVLCTLLFMFMLLTATGGGAVTPMSRPDEQIKKWYYTP